MYWYFCRENRKSTISLLWKCCVFFILCLWRLLSIKIRLVLWELEIISQMPNLIYKWYFPQTWVMTENYCITPFAYICIHLFRTHMHMTKIEWVLDFSYLCSSLDLYLYISLELWYNSIIFILWSSCPHPVCGEFSFSMGYLGYVNFLHSPLLAWPIRSCLWNK